MQLYTARLTPFFRKLISGRRLFLLPFIVLIVILIYFGVSWWKQKNSQLAGVAVSNVTSYQATVSFVTAAKEKTCVIAVAMFPPGIHTACDREVTRIHFLSISSLAPRAVYRLVITRGGFINWQMSISFKPDTQAARQLLPVIAIPDKDIDKDQNNTQVIIGKVNDQNGVLQKDGVVTLTSHDGRAVWSGVTNDHGAFSIPVSGTKLSGTIGVNVWTNTGFMAEELEGSDLSIFVPLLTVAPYEE